MFKHQNCNNLIFVDNKDKEKIMGIYGIIVNNEIVYVGQSNNIVKRCKQHTLKITKPIEKCEKYKGDLTPLYIELKQYFFNNINIKFVILERIKNANLLKEREKFYINKYQPKLSIHDW